MNLEISVIVVSLGILLAIGLLLYMIGRSSNNDKTRLKAAFKKSLLTNSLTVTQQDEWNGRVIAVDDEAGKLLFVRCHNSNISEVLINLKLISDILLETDEDVELVFLSKAAEPVRLMFYSAADDNLSNEVIFRSIAIRWHINLRQRWKIIKKRTY